MPQEAPSEVVRGGPVGLAKTAVDSVLLMGPHGSGAPYIGTFEDAEGGADWHGWSPHDETDGAVNHWHVDTYNVPAGTYAAWCGDAYPSCGPGDPEGGYGNNYHDFLDWRGTVADPGLPCTVRITALVNHDVEVGYDYCYLGVVTVGGARTDLWSTDGLGVAVVLDETFTYQPGDYVGDALDEVQVTFLVESDGGASDEDCLYGAFGAGALQVDNIVITLDNGTGASHDFEDGTLGPFEPRNLGGVGSFAGLWNNLDDLDPCVDNHTWQVAFIDDGEVVPGTGGSPCVNWCYGPGGYIVNTTGGLAGPDAHLNNSVRSPVMAWPDPAHVGAWLEFTAYHDQSWTTGILYEMAVRSVDTGNPAEIEFATWHGTVSFGSGSYDRVGLNLSRHLAHPTHVQLRFSAIEMGWVWGDNGDDGSPGPYLDNVRLVTHAPAGGTISAEPRFLAQDGFPATGVVDPVDLGTNSVRFDMAASIDPPEWGTITPGDSIVFETFIAPGAHLDRLPRLYYKLQPNEDYDPYRSSGLPLEGFVECDTVRNAAGIQIPDRWCADLPDIGFLYPGDDLHYYLEIVTDQLGAPAFTTLPADTTGFGRFFRSPYDPQFCINALPSPGETLLWWDDSGQTEDWPLWLETFDGLCYWPEDVFRSPPLATGTGLGARATVALLAQYRTIIYVSGRQADFTLGAGDAEDPAPDVQVLADWLDLSQAPWPNRKWLAVLGAGVADDLANGNVDAVGFLENRLGVYRTSEDVIPLIDGQTEPLVETTAFFSRAGSWMADLVCAGTPTLGAFLPATGGERLAEFTGPGGVAGQYTYAAASGTRDETVTANVVLVPFDVASLERAPDKYWDHISVRSNITWDILDNFGQLPVFNNGCGYSDVPEQDLPAVFSARSYPNPFNPRVRIDYTVARPGQMKVTIFDVRGRVVAVLADRPVTESGHLIWDGKDGSGAAAASGVYFYRVRVDDVEKIGKMALIR